ncbi:predicted protein [Uncinocarpus reesii 1704]|uniref:Uncharacterized protein n=1 Tax=Uncinocarpus reesii (strain UAMH 1704) TaxID=336963 RepID=C4JU50_UNCRE|nr:uncharacterized protein UREG_05989 [Uncinocarpus reesii 1704]EEP81147.1 predicted protein [Uncinocarpus reesii 1704]
MYAGSVYFAYRRADDDDDDDMFMGICNRLRAATKGHALSLQCGYLTSTTRFLVHRKAHQNRKIALSSLASNPDAVSLSDMELCTAPPAQRYTVISLVEFWKISRINGGMYCEVGTTGRLLDDWPLQSLESLFDFTVKEVDYSRPGLGPLVRLEHLPSWEPFQSDYIRLERVTVIFCQHLTHAPALVQEDVWSHFDPISPNPSPPCKHINYLVLSVKELFMCTVCVQSLHGTLRTEPQPFLNGTDMPPRQSIGLAVSATAPSLQMLRLHLLPVEIQQLILSRVSLGPIEPARLGCMLSLGSPFRWLDGGRPIQRQEVLTTKPTKIPVESHIQFDGDHSGVAYKVRQSNPRY